MKYVGFLSFGYIPSIWIFEPLLEGSGVIQEVGSCKGRYGSMPFGITSHVDSSS